MSHNIESLQVNLRKITESLSTAIDSGDLDSLRQASLHCDRYLRSHLPLNQDLGNLERAHVTHALEKLLAAHEKAITMVGNQRALLEEQLYSAKLAAVQVGQYLDVSQGQS